MKKHFILTALILLCLTLAAQIKFTVSPPKYELFVSKSETKTFTVTVNNLGDSIMHVKVYPSDWILDFDSRLKFLPPGTVKNSCSGWLYINPQEFNIEAGSYTEVRVTMNVPEDSYGDYWSLLFFESSPIISPDKPAVAFNSRLGCTLYASINGTLSRNGEITSMEYSPKQNNVKVGFSNTGNMHLRLKGFLQILRDSTVIYEKNMSEQLILPETERTVLFPVETFLSKGTYTLKVNIDYGGSEILEGEKSISVE